MTAASGVQTLLKMKIYSIIKSVKAEKNASFQQTGLLKTSPPLPPPFPLPLLPPWKKMDISSPGILPKPWLVWFYHRDHSSHWFFAGTIFRSSCSRHQELVHRQCHLADCPPALFVEFHPRGLLPLSKGKWTASCTGLSFAQESLKMTWVGVSRKVTIETLTATFHRWFERREKCFRIGGGHANTN